MQQSSSNSTLETSRESFTAFITKMGTTKSSDYSLYKIAKLGDYDWAMTFTQHLKRTFKPNLQRSCHKFATLMVQLLFHVAPPEKSNILSKNNWISAQHLATILSLLMCYKNYRAKDYYCNQHIQCNLPFRTCAKPMETSKSGDDPETGKI